MDQKEFAEVIRLIAQKWTIPVLDELSGGSRSHNELARAIGADHQQLARVLQPLVRKKIVNRKVHAVTAPVRVYYSLTPTGKAIAAACHELHMSIAAAIEILCDDL